MSIFSWLGVGDGTSFADEAAGSMGAGNISGTVTDSPLLRNSLP